MKKVILTKGLPASGKDTWAKSVIDSKPGSYKRVNKDYLREMLDNTKWSKKNEQFVLKLRDHIILTALSEGKHVIVSDTNLHPKHEKNIRELVKGLATVSIQDFTHVTPEICIERDNARANGVGSKVIWGMYNQFLAEPKSEITPYKWDSKLPTAILCDLDGTLCKIHNRSPYDVMDCDTDTPNPPIQNIVLNYRDKYPVIFLSGRDGKAYDKTVKWLNGYIGKYEALYMRAPNDCRKDSIVKWELFQKHIAGKYNVLFILDDRNQVVDMWREHGLTCLQVAPGAF